MWNVTKGSLQNGTGLSLEIANDLCDRQSNSYAQTTLSKSVQVEMENKWKTQ